MTPLRLSSFFFSLCIHAGVIAAVLFWPADPYRPGIDLDAPTFDFDIYTIGKEGSLAPGDAVPQIPQSQSPDHAPEAPHQPPEGPPDPPPAPPAATPPEPAPAKPEAAPEAVAVPKPEVVEKAPEVKPEPKPEPKPEAKPEPKKPEPAKPRRPRENPDDVLRRALGDLGSQEGRGSVSRALGELQNSPGSSSTPGPGGSGGDGIGIVGSYMQSLVSRIRPNWEYQGRADRRNPRAVATITIAGDGTITDAVISQSSGDTAFDGSVLKAIRDTERVEPPPTEELRKVNVPFAYRSLLGGK